FSQLNELVDICKAKYAVDPVVVKKAGNVAEATKDGAGVKALTESTTGVEEVEAITKSAGESIKVSEEKMYQLGKHFNKHGRDMGYAGKAEYEAAARKFFEKNKETAEIYEGIWNSSRGAQSGQVQIVVRQNGKQLIINKETGQIIDFYEGTSLDGFINIERIQ
ncbi:hypothetical protein D6856_15060, partial [Butyrivibrio sp. XB500-5]|uniref:hypothetical protein n=1 Tax=Butyrivibrio sp. XB500-5 TaxID=2364880 RepID=UPI000EEBF099